MRRFWVEPSLVFVVVFAVYVAATPVTGQAYRHFVYMARAFLSGQAHLEDVPPYYHDLIHFRGRIYAPFPPVPALLLAPAVALRGEATDQGRIGQGLAALAVAVFAAALRRFGFPLPVRLFCAAGLAFGSVLWSATAIGTTWFFAQIVVVLSTAWLLLEYAGKGRGLAVGAAFAAAWLTRVSVLPALPVFAAALWIRHRRTGPVAAFLAVNALGVVIYMGYNYARFGHLLESGYGLLSMAAVNAEAVERWGFFNLRFVPEHLYAMFVRVPEFLAAPPFFKPSPWGMSLLLTSPIVVRLMFPSGHTYGWWPWGAAALSMIGPMLMFFSVGWVQFGYRYSLDWWPFVLVLLASALGVRPRPADYALLAVSIAVNGLGAYWVRALGW